MDTTRRQLLAAIPAVGIPIVGVGGSIVAGGLMIGAQDAPAPERADWEYNFAGASPWWYTAKRWGKEIADLTEDDWSQILERNREYFKEQGEQGWSVAHISPPAIDPTARDSAGNPIETMIVLLKRPRDERKRVAWEFRMFRPKGNSHGQIVALGRQGWEVFYTTSFDLGKPDLIHAQRPVRKEV